jgi:hypothetical protein
MYTVNHRQHRHKIFLRFFLFVFPFLIALSVLCWLLFYRNDSSSASFVQPGVQVASVQPETKDFTSEYFKLTLPTTWVANGRKNPTVFEVYYEYQNSIKNEDNRWLRVYVDVFPRDMALNKLLPVTIVDNRLVPSSLSDECQSFTGAPSQNNGNTNSQTWKAKWQGVEFVCNMSVQRNYIGIATAENGYALPLAGTVSGQHNYFILYIDHNVHPDYQPFMNAVKSFQTI